jgi:hypothetical protein
MRLLYFVLKYDPCGFHIFTMTATYTEYSPYDQRKVGIVATTYATPVFSGRSPSLRVPPPRKTGTTRRMRFHCIVIAYTSLRECLRRFQGKVGV